MKKISMFMLLGALVLMGGGGPVWAAAPAIEIDLNLEQDFYGYGEPIGVEVVVRNETGADLLVSQWFSSRIYYLQMRVIDPAGRLLLISQEEPEEEAPGDMGAEEPKEEA